MMRGTGKPIAFCLCLIIGLAWLPGASQARPWEILRGFLSYDCQEGDYAACKQLVLTYPHDNGVIDFDRAKELADEELSKLRPACDAGDMAACGAVASLSINYGDGLEDPEIYDLFARACDAGEAIVCSQYSDLRDLQPEELPSAYGSFYNEQAKACSEGETTACVNQSHLNVLVEGVSPDMEIWLAQVERLCTENQARACAVVSYVLSDDAEEHRHLAPESDYTSFARQRRGMKAALKACSLGNPIGCWNTALNYEEGEGVETDWRLSQLFYVRACNGGLSDACDEINYHSYWDEDDPLILLDPACAAGDFSACHFAAVQRHSPIFTQPEADDDIARMKRYEVELREICEMGSHNACSDAAVLLRGLGQAGQAKRYATVACNIGAYTGCHVLGNILKLDQAGPENERESIFYYEFACENEIWGACNNLGDSLEHGLGVDVDEDRAAQLYAEACDNGIELGCANLKELEEKTDDTLKRECKANPDDCRED